MRRRQSLCQKARAMIFFKELPISYLAFIENNQANICSLTVQIWSRSCSIVNEHVIDSLALLKKVFISFDTNEI